MARASIATFTSLDEVAKLVGISPAHFNTAYAGDIAWQPCGVCADFWYQYAHQSATGFSRDLLARAVAEAEIQLGRMLGHPVAPTLKRQVFDYIPYAPHTNFQNFWLEMFGRTRSYMVDSPCGLGPAYYLGPHLRKYKPRKWVQVVTASTADFNLVYSDTDSDGFAETATISFSLPQVSQPCNLGLFNYGYFGQTTWRIRPLKSVSYLYNVGTGQYDYTVTVDTWQLIRPELWEEPPRAVNMTQCDLRAIDLTDAGVLVDQVMVGIQIEDPSFPLVKFRFEQHPGSSCGNTNCLACTAREVTGCYAELTRAHDFVVPVPATYSEENGWCAINAFSCCGQTPGTVEITYWDGLEGDYVNDALCGPTPNQAIRHMIALLAVSRVQLGQCDCDCNKGQFWKKLGEDLTETKGAGRYLSFDVINNQFGLTRGEIMVFERFRAYTMNNPVVTYGAH